MLFFFLVQTLKLCIKMKSKLTTRHGIMNKGEITYLRYGEASTLTRLSVSQDRWVQLPAKNCNRNFLLILSYY